ncbi:hypothetical protein vBBaMIFTN2_36 [Bordetella phage vB_BaM-IFTN2]|nr:hypothetical protein vBBaMIFTN2_36 [Bordetella phage vB_BaM-IFTN2]UOK17299.1 hypothetical protein vBBaMIFTN5_35 [Bordetella phage vB_BaM-IFTN5]
MLGLIRNLTATSAGVRIAISPPKQSPHLAGIGVLLDG